MPRTEKLWQEIVTIPLHCGLSNNDVQTVIKNVLAFERTAS
jgi:dTDP-4-amino-4,6-dideoxygalactose transaminase